MSSKKSKISYIISESKIKRTESKGKYFDKLSINLIRLILKYLNFEENLSLCILSKKFLGGFCRNRNFDEEEDQFLNLKCLIKLINLSKINQSPFLNIQLNMNLFNSDPLLSDANFKNDSSKYKVLSYFMEKIYKNSNKQINKYIIEINSESDYSKNLFLLDLFTNDVVRELKYYLKINKKVDLEKSAEFVKGFNYADLQPYNDDNSKRFFKESQDYIFSNNIKMKHRYIWSKKITDTNINYFEKNQNTLIGINTLENSDKICNFNKESLKKINVENWAPSEFNLNNSIKLKKIKFDYPSVEFSNILLEKINFDNLEEISGFIINELNINDFIRNVNNLKNLKKLFRIGFDDEESSEVQRNLFKNFFKGIQESQHNNLIELSTFSYVFRKGVDYELIMDSFPNIRRIQEDYDCSSLYDQRIEVRKGFSCNAEKDFKPNDLKAITKLLNNYIKQKFTDGLDFELYVDSKRLMQLFGYFNENNENEVLNHINNINFIVQGDNDDEILPGIKKIKYINFNEENNCLFSLLKNVEVINSVKLDAKYFTKFLDFAKNKTIYTILVDKYGNNLKIIEEIINCGIKKLMFMFVEKKDIDNFNKKFKDTKIIFVSKEEYLYNNNF